jgi:hypothetical protein
VQLQFDLAVPSARPVEITLGAAATAGTLPLVPVEQTLINGAGTTGPRVWAVLPASWLSSSGVAGPMLPREAVAGTPLAAWDRLCDHLSNGVDSFLPVAGERTSWLYDRGTALYRSYQRTGELAALRSAYRETALYRNGITGIGTMTRIGVPGAAEDLKYHYGQGMAIHYLLTGDDRFREAAEGVATRAAALWPQPAQAAGAFWNERSAGFALLAYEWAAAVSDDKAATFDAAARAAVDAYLAGQASFPASYTDQTARCFAHTSEAHGDVFGTTGCSPWMSAILAEGLDQHARRVGGSRAAAVRAALVQLGRIIARDGRDPAGGRPFYWMGLANAADEPDDFDEHWGESAYLVAMAWHHGGRSDAFLRAAADELVSGLERLGEAPMLRSFGWQCRTAPLAPVFLQ